MIDLYTWTTPNGRKASIMLEEVGLKYAVHPIDITKGEQFLPAFLKISPNNKIPAIVDPEGPDGTPMALFESGAILIYLAEKTGRDDLLPASGAQRHKVMQWLMWQMGGFGPMLGQAHHFWKFAKEDVPYAKERYKAETERLYRVLDAQLGKCAFVAGETYTIADIAIYPWVDRHDYQPIAFSDYPNVMRWYDRIGEREAVNKGMEVPHV